MALKHRIADLTYRTYDRMRHREAFTSAAQPAMAVDFSGLRDERYALLVTFRKDGTPVPTPIWFGLLDDRRVVLRTEERTAKVRRIRRDSRARLLPCDQRGKPLGAAVDGTARILESPEECAAAERALDEHYGRMRRVYERVLAPQDGMVYVEVAAG